MSYHVVFTDTAKEDLRSIALWIAEQSGSIDISKRFINEIRANCNKLKEFPDRGAVPHDYVLRSLGYRFITCRNYLMFYQISETNETVNIMAVFNAKQDYMQIMRNHI